ncbi:ABC transporter ATP-binding protein OS=Castellaniella sp OX=1955812 GN=EPN31_08240 PE=3 SV=1 [Castellaniella denitrificans]|uniref:urea ABC transporter ATP-binding subunit UrtE n=1 Tax=Castellaniella sp. TaxID=1955812 RepID=UPI002AFE45A3|nr:urea ABC transporter ATP-binding subunit UrtE [Castellaniella sp.]
MLSVRDLNVFYGESHAIHDLSFDLAPNETLAVMGRNGMGKTTLFKSLIGMLRAKTGNISFDGKELNHTPSHVRVGSGLAFVPQGRMIFPFLTVEENIFAAIRDPRRKSVPEYLYRFFPVLKEMRSRKGGNLSGGQQQMLAIARALATDPRVLILDEPTEGIQPSIIKEIACALNDLKKERELSILVSEQVLSFAMAVADRIVVIDRGYLVHEESCATLDADKVRSFLTV